MIELLILISINLAFTVGFVAFALYLFWKTRPVVELALGFAEVSEESIGDHASKGGLAQAAKTGEKKLLSQMIKRTLTDASGGISDIAMMLIPDLDEWLEKNPYAVLRLFQNPQIQGILQQFLGQLGQAQPQQQGDNQFGTKETKATWW